MFFKLQLVNRFENRMVVVATKHGKESVIAPLLKTHFQLKCVLPPEFDTDVFGTFSGEVERPGDPLTTLRKKCLGALQISGADLVVGSEGSFGIHPVYGFGYAGIELMMLLDSRNNIEITAGLISTETNFAGADIEKPGQLLDFAERIGFPSHALILRNVQNGSDALVKGIQSQDELLKTYHDIQNRFGSVYAETDMRAMHNPTRMKSIAKLTEKLIEKMKSECPRCTTPGFDITDRITGLPCSECGTPTRSTLSHVYCCSHCGFTTEKMHPAGKQFEDAGLCDRCNP